MIKDRTPKFGNPDFVNPGGAGIADYIPQNTSLILNKGIEIPLLPGDGLGLLPGLAVKFDILGNAIVGRPDMGAIELSDPQD